MMIRLLLALIGLSVCYLAPVSAADLRVVSFNIQFLGSSSVRRNADLVDLLAPFDIVFVQELVAPPYPGSYPDGSPFVPDRQAAAFFDEMRAKGFDFVLSDEDTGTGVTIHLDSTATEWFVAFYKPGKVSLAEDLPHGFLADDRSDNPDFERVPYAFAFRAGHADLVFISVHLKPDAGPANRARRAHELTTIFSWITSRPGPEHDFVVLGDMNFQTCGEITSNIPQGYATLNDPCRATNVSPTAGKPFDQVLYSAGFSSREINIQRGLTVINLIDEMRARWGSTAGAFPGDPYDALRFRLLYSDHHPIRFNVRVNKPDDD